MDTIIEKNLNWQIPAKNPKAIVEDFREMVKAAEDSGFMPYEEYREKLNEWIKENL